MHTHHDVPSQPLMGGLARGPKRNIPNPGSLRHLATAGLLAAVALGAYTVVGAPLNAPAAPADASVPQAYENLTREQQLARAQRRLAVSTAGQGSTLPGYLKSYLQFVGDN